MSVKRSDERVVSINISAINKKRVASRARFVTKRHGHGSLRSNRDTVRSPRAPVTWRSSAARDRPLTRARVAGCMRWDCTPRSPFAASGNAAPSRCGRASAATPCRAPSPASPRRTAPPAASSVVAIENHATLKMKSSPRSACSI